MPDTIIVRDKAQFPTGLDNTPIGATTPAASNFTNVDLTGQVQGDIQNALNTIQVGNKLRALMTDPRGLWLMKEAPATDMVVNGGFDTDTDWIKAAEWTIAGGVAHCDGTQTANASLIQAVSGVVASTKYVVQFTISNIVSGTVKCYFQGVNIESSTNGTHRFSALGNSPSISIYGLIGFEGDIDNVSITPAILDVHTGVESDQHDGQFMGTWTSGDLLKQGRSLVYDPNGTDAYIDVGDSDDFSFGDGGVDSPFTIFGLIEVVDGAAQMIIGKWDKTSGVEAAEYNILLDSSRMLGVTLRDESSNEQPLKITNAAISVGWHSFVATYSGLGGATAADGITIYIDGVEVASTATNKASYVAMENLDTPVWFGAYEGSAGTPVALMVGDNGAYGIDGVEMSAADAWNVHNVLLEAYSENGVDFS